MTFSFLKNPMNRTIEFFGCRHRILIQEILYSQGISGSLGKSEGHQLQTMEHRSALSYDVPNPFVACRAAYMVLHCTLSRLRTLYHVLSTIGTFKRELLQCFFKNMRTPTLLRVHQCKVESLVV